MPTLKLTGRPLVLTINLVAGLAILLYVVVVISLFDYRPLNVLIELTTRS